MTYVKRKHCALKFLKRAYIRILLGIMYPTIQHSDFVSIKRSQDANINVEK